MSISEERGVKWLEQSNWNIVFFWFFFFSWPLGHPDTVSPSGMTFSWLLVLAIFIVPEVCPYFINIHTSYSSEGVCPWLLTDFFYLQYVIVVGTFFIILGHCSLYLLLSLTTIAMVVFLVLSTKPFLQYGYSIFGTWHSWAVCPGLLQLIHPLWCVLMTLISIVWGSLDLDLLFPFWDDDCLDHNAFWPWIILRPS